jgi:uncharacterized protein (DUF1015 family)
MPVVLVSGDDPGLMIFATHRVVRHATTTDGKRERVADALERLRSAPQDAAAAAVYSDGGAGVVTSPEVALDTELVDGEIVAYTPDVDEAVAMVDRGDGDAAYLLRPPRIEDVWAIAERGDVMPQKSTYFYPKLLSGLLLHPLD